MAMDWLSALATQDQSFEAQLAKRDLSKKIALLQDLAQQAEHRREFAQTHNLAERHLGAQIEENKARMAETKATQEELKRSREVDDKRLQVSQFLSAPPGTTYTDPSAINMIRGAGAGDRISPDPKNPVGPGQSFMLDRRKYEDAKTQADFALEEAKKREVRAVEDQGFQREAAERAKREEKERNKDRDARRKGIEDRNKAIALKMTDMLPEYAKAADRDAAQVLKDMDVSPDFIDWARGVTQEQIQEHRQAAQLKVIEGYRVQSDKEKARRMGKTAITPPTGNPPESPEHRVWRHMGMIGPEPK